MRRRPFCMPWSGRDIPHGVLDVLRGCNVSCLRCYNTLAPAVKPFSEVMTDLDRLLALRRVHTVTITGGECTLHPDLPAIVREVRSRGLRATIVSNGFRLREGSLLRELAAAGLDMVLLHVQAGQQRSDLPPAATEADARRLLEELAAGVVRYGMLAGLSIIIRRATVDGVHRVFDMVLESPCLDFALMTGEQSFDTLGRVAGDVLLGLRQVGPSAVETFERVTCDEVGRLLAQTGHRPFSYVPSALDSRRRRWLSYVVGVVADGTGRIVKAGSVTPGFADPLFVRLVRILAGRYIFLYHAGPRRFRIQLLLNALSGGYLRGNLELLAASWRPGHTLRDKHIIFQEAPNVLPDGTVEYCRDCPDAAILRGSLVPSCLFDRMVDGSKGEGGHR